MGEKSLCSIRKMLGKNLQSPLKKCKFTTKSPLKKCQIINNQAVLKKTDKYKKK